MNEMDVLWVHGSSRAKFEAAYVKIARFLDIPGREERDVDVLELLQDHLSHNHRRQWLMVVDNADDSNLWLHSSEASKTSSKALIDYLPRHSHGKILFTTRDTQLGTRLVEGKYEPIHLERLGPNEAEKLLRAKLLDNKNLNSDDANALSEALEHLPLTITQAAAYLNQVEMSASEYLAVFRKGLSDIPELLEQSVDDPSRDRETSNSVFQTWRLSFERIAGQNPRAAELLCLMAMLDRQKIGQDLLRMGDESPIRFKAAVSKLKAFSFVVEDMERSEYSLHRLVQLSTQSWVEHLGKVPFFQEMALSIVSSQCPRFMEYEDWPAFADLIAHVNVVLEYQLSTPSARINQSKVFHSAGHYSMQQGQDTLAIAYFDKARTIRAEILGPEHEDTLTSASLIGVGYSKLGRSYWRKAQKVQLEVLEKAKKTLGINHRLTLKSMSRLAITYNRQGDVHRCRELQEDVLQRMENEYGLEDPDTLTEMSNLLYTLNYLKKWQEANQVGQLALSLRSKILGPAHPDTITIMANLARGYREQGRWAEATQFEEEVLDLRIQTIGTDHPKTLQAMSNLAHTFRSQKRHAEAAELQRYVLEVRTRTLGSKHPHTIYASKAMQRWQRQDADAAYYTRGTSQVLESEHGRKTPTKSSRLSPLPSPLPSPKGSSLSSRESRYGHNRHQGSRDSTLGLAPDSFYRSRSLSTGSSQQDKNSAGSTPPPEYSEQA